MKTSNSTAMKRPATARKSSTARKTATKKATTSRPGATAGNDRAGSHPDLEKIFKDLLKDIYWAEKNLVKGLKKMAKNASDPGLQDAYTLHLGQTEDQVGMLEEAFGMLGMKAQGKKCAAMEGLLEEADEHIETYEKGPGLDAALIVGAQKIEHYEIATYGSLQAIAAVLGYTECAGIFEEIKQQEEETDDALTEIAITVNSKAGGTFKEEGEDDSDTEAA